MPARTASVEHNVKQNQQIRATCVDARALDAYAGAQLRLEENDLAFAAGSRTCHRL
jgi:hypothetical protein